MPKLPVCELRPYQEVIWDDWFARRVRKMILEWHRRAGKDLFSLNVLISEALIEVGNYWFLLPESQQVRNGIWEGVTKDGTKYLDYFPKGLIYKVDNQSMKVYLRDPRDTQKVGSIVSFLGGDRYDKRVGAGLKGCVISEYSLQKPNLYDLVIEPMLKETNGWVIFNYTPRGENHATNMFDFLQGEGGKYIASRLTIDDTGGVMDPKSLDEERRRGKPEEIIQQEYYCSREGAIYGSYYGDILKRYEKQTAVVPHDPAYPVHTLWDIGISDSMAIWFVQFIGKAIHIIDYYENENYGLGHYASVIQGKGYLYAMHHLPHDGNKRELTVAEKAITIEAQLKKLGVTPIKVHPARADIYGTIQRVRAILPRCYFDKEKCRDGREALKQYRREYDENRQRFKDTPYHDWTSHGSDAFSLITLVESVALQREHHSPAKKWDGRFR